MIFMILLLCILFFFISNYHITISRQRVACKKASAHACPLSIVQISDLHNQNFGLRQAILCKKIQALRPDLIAVTGDLVDHAPYQHAMAFMKHVSKLCPVYYVRGNHECLAGNYEKQELLLHSFGVTILKNESAVFTKDGRTYQITGLDDPIFQGLDANYMSLVKKTLDHLQASLPQQPSACPDFQILLAHRPELFHLYSSYPYDLVLCGHAHGGQFRLPGIGGLYAPNQGIFPRYTSGLHRENGTAEIISRGLGNSSFPLRLFNFPEIVHVLVQ